MNFTMLKNAWAVHKIFLSPSLRPVATVLLTHMNKTVEKETRRLKQNVFDDEVVQKLD